MKTNKIFRDSLQLNTYTFINSSVKPQWNNDIRNILVI